jgi:hypothetical protein
VYSDWGANTIVVGVTLASVAACVLLHYEGLSLLSRGLMARHARHPRRKVLYGVFGVLGLHGIEIWLFGLAIWGLAAVDGAGGLAGTGPAGLLDAVYVSAMMYTTVGSMGLEPVGALRLLTGTVALAGFVMITWSASFMFLEMERFWRR